MESLLIWFGSGFAFAVGVFVGASLMTVANNAKKAKSDMDEKILGYWGENSKFQTEMLALTASKISTLAEIADALNSLEPKGDPSEKRSVIRTSDGVLIETSP